MNFFCSNTYQTRKPNQVHLYLPSAKIAKRILLHMVTNRCKFFSTKIFDQIEQLGGTICQCWVHSWLIFLYRKDNFFLITTTFCERITVRLVRFKHNGLYRQFSDRTIFSLKFIVYIVPPVLYCSSIRAIISAQIDADDHTNCNNE